MNRRDALFSIAGGAAVSILGTPARAPGFARSKGTQLGIAQFSYNIRLKAGRSGRAKIRLDDPLNFLDHCHEVGAGGVQMSIGVREETFASKLRHKAEAYGMFVEGSAGLPPSRSDVEKFEAVVRTAKQAGANVIRVAMGGRRYEQFDRAEQFRTFADRSQKSLQLGEPVAARHGMRLAIENHKDRRIPEMLEMLNHISSEYVGLCVDTGNSFALLEDPMATVEAYAPWALAAHLKDMALAEYEDGFLLADVPLGKGVLNLPEMVGIFRKANPGINFSLEMATRDPLQVPCLTEKYWATFEDVPGSDLARTLRYVRANASSKQILPKVNHLPTDKLVRIEETNIKQSLAYAKEHLDL